jgi:hypothetical protein
MSRSMSMMSSGICKSKPFYTFTIFSFSLRDHSARTRELPGHHPFVVVQNFVKAITMKWEAPALSFSDSVHDIVMEFVEKLVAEHFGQYATGGLQQHVTYVVLSSICRDLSAQIHRSVILVDHIRKCAEASRAKIDWLLGLEDLPFTVRFPAPSIEIF